MAESTRSHPPPPPADQTPSAVPWRLRFAFAGRWRARMAEWWRAWREAMRPAPWNPSWSRLEKGRWGERAAARYLWREKGHRILGRNVVNRGGETDLVTDDRGTLVFVEVKTRSDPERNPPLPAVDVEKMRRLRAAARYYLATIRSPRPPARIDLVGVTPHPDTGAPQIAHVEEAARLGVEDERERQN